MKNVFTVLLLLIAVLSVACLCTRLNREQELLKASKLNVQVAEKRKEAAEVELENAMYRWWLIDMQYKDLNLKDKWKEELEQFKKENGFYDE